jgi:hypothetical protein
MMFVPYFVHVFLGVHNFAIDVSGAALVSDRRLEKELDLVVQEAVLLGK